MKSEQRELVVARNKKARHDYQVLDTYEAGLVLVGDEVKSLRMGRASLVDGFVDVDAGEAWLHQVQIPPYSQSSRMPGGGRPGRRGDLSEWSRRKRKLLLHRKEIEDIERQVGEKGLTVVPLSLYFSGGRAKVEIAVARGKRDWDKRQTLRARDADREAEQAVSRRLKGMRD
ncbi:SsrA-binding protein [Marmoricola endophyticus]|uniref:SsrA-binding protein n=1 Tax=Marmoricola endophyticus TaxID=2040280 RepID=A0A917F5P9_9ACTN|nr:SsrA-binding protein SmpB [Marmoricola endophyticus]GGF50718.1 SsrA-binding protein [Marmoricola endophyticus]